MPELQRCGIQTFGGSAGRQRDEILRTFKKRRISFGIECSVEKLTGWKLAGWDDHLGQGCWRLLEKHMMPIIAAYSGCGVSGAASLVFLT